MCTHCESMATLSEDNQDSSCVLTLRDGRCLTSATLLFLQQQYRCHCHSDVQPRTTCQHPASVGLLAVPRSDTCHVSSASNQTIPWVRPILTATEFLRCSSCSSTQNTILKTPWASFNRSVDLCPLFSLPFPVHARKLLWTSPTGIWSPSLPLVSLPDCGEGICLISYQICRPKEVVQVWILGCVLLADDL